MQAFFAACDPTAAALRLERLCDQAKANGHWGGTSDETFKTAISRTREQAEEKDIMKKLISLLIHEINQLADWSTEEIARQAQEISEQRLEIARLKAIADEQTVRANELAERLDTTMEWDRVL
jgi:hypothetical protein